MLVYLSSAYCNLDRRAITRIEPAHNIVVIRDCRLIESNPILYLIIYFVLVDALCGFNGRVPCCKEL